MDKSAVKIQNYWESRAALDTSVQSTTMDIYLREVEVNFILKILQKHKPSLVYDIGCGDGMTTIRCARDNAEMLFAGFDYSKNMIENAESNMLNAGITNAEFNIGDINNPLTAKKCDFAYSTRCLQNLVDWDAQKNALTNISDVLVSGGLYLMIENFNEGHNLFNELRSDFSLPEIPVRDHNYFFNRDQTLEFLSESFDVVHEKNISSSYYVVSRIIYSAICKNEGIEPDYNDIHHELAAKLPYFGEFGPTRALLFKKK